MSDIEHSIKYVQNEDRRSDRRVERTKIAIQRALIELVLVDGYDKVTVQEIAAQANVGRSTFYSHFQSKEDVLLRSLDGLHQSIRAAWLSSLQQTNREKGQAGFVLPLVRHLGQNLELWRALATGDGPDIVLRKLRAILVELFRTDLGVSQASQFVEQAEVHVRVGALMELLTWWLDHGAQLTPDAIYEVFFRSLGYQ